jgi:hypothetical protein
MCGHVNEEEFVFSGILCCEECGCTKFASDARKREIEHADEMVPEMQGDKRKGE